MVLYFQIATALNLKHLQMGQQLFKGGGDTINISFCVFSHKILHGQFVPVKVQWHISYLCLADKFQFETRP